MSDFDEKIHEALQHAILDQIGKCQFVEYHHGKKGRVPQDLVDKAWDAIDWDEILGTINGRIEDAICAVVVNSMLTEIKTDTKKVLQIEGVRQKIRAVVYPQIMQALEGVDPQSRR